MNLVASVEAKRTKEGRMSKKDFVSAANEHGHNSDYKVWEQNKYTDERMSAEFAKGVCQALSCVFLFMNYMRQTLVYDSDAESDYGQTDKVYLSKFDYALRYKMPSVDLKELRGKHFPGNIPRSHHDDGSATFQEFLRWSESTILISSLQHIEHKTAKELDPFGVGCGPNVKVDMIIRELTKGNMIVAEAGTFGVDAEDGYAALKKFAKWGYYLLQFDNHAMAVVVREYASKCKFFDPNYGIVQFWETASLIQFAKQFLAAERPNESFKVLRLV